MIKTRDLCVGKWPGILRQLGISDSFLTGKHGPCPGCGGKDRFRFADQDGSGNYYCNQCGNGDGFALAMMVTGKTFNEVAKEIDHFVGNIEQGKIMTTDYEKNAERLQQISAELLPIDANVRGYLKWRGLPVCKNLRLHPGLPYYEDGKFLRTIPAMIARVSAPDGSLITYHCTFLENGAKANVAQVKKFLPPAQPLSGGAERLTKDYRHIGITEGVESALACMRRFELPVWAAGNTSMLKAFVPPACVESVIVFADNDANYAGQVAAYTLANKLMINHGLVADVVVPGRVGDFADEHNNGALLDNVVIVKEAQT